MIRLACLLLIGVVVTSGCAATAPSPDREAAPASTAQIAATLPRYQWQLVSARDAAGQSIAALFPRGHQPLALLFIDDRIVLAHGCNRQGASYRVRNGQLIVGHMMSTMMACPDSVLMGRDRAAAKALTGTHALVLNDATPPTLTLSTAVGSALVFSGDVVEPQASGAEAGR